MCFGDRLQSETGVGLITATSWHVPQNAFEKEAQDARDGREIWMHYGQVDESQQTGTARIKARPSLFNLLPCLNS